jgi:hypothetical protein
MADGADLSVNSAEQAAEATEPVQAEETAEEAVGGKRKRRSKLEKAEDDVKANKELQETTEGQLTVLTAQGVLDSRARAKLKKVTEKLATLRARLPELVAALEKIKEEKAQETARAEARATQEKEKAELSRAIGDASLLTLTELRLKKDSEFDNTVDRSDAIWARILAEYNAKCTCNELPIDDKIETIAGARRRFDREMGEFRQWAQMANRAVTESGVPADEVEDKVKTHYRITTSLFIKHGWWARPMSIPPTQISGDTAAVGGVENVLGGGGVSPAAAAAAAEEEEEEVVVEDDDEEEEEEEEPTESPPPATASTAPPRPSAGPAGPSMAAKTAPGGKGKSPPPPPSIGGARGGLPPKKPPTTAEALSNFSTTLAEEGRLQRAHEVELANQCKQQ